MDRDQAITLLAHLFDGCTGSVQFVALRPGSESDLFVISPRFGWSHAMGWAERQSAAERNVYVACAAQPPGSVGHRTKASAYEISFLWADVDGLLNEAAKQAAAQRLIDSDRITSLVDSGGGLHVYAKLPRPIRVGEENREALRDTIRAFGAGCYALVLGVAPRKVDRHDLASVLRVPTTRSWPDEVKRRQGRVPVDTGVLYLQRNGTVPLAAFTDWVIAYSRAEGASSLNGNGLAHDVKLGELPKDWHKRLLSDPVLWDRWSNPLATYPSLSEAALSIATRMCARWPRDSDSQRLAALALFYESHRRRAPRTKLRLTLTNALAGTRAAAECASNVFPCARPTTASRSLPVLFDGSSVPQREPGA